MPPSAPAISVVIPCRDEARHIEQTVRSVLEQREPPGGFEVLVVDGMSTDGTREILARISRQDGRLRVIDNRQRVAPAAFNLGIRAAQGRVIVIMGAHNVYAPDYLFQSAAVLEETGADNVGGAMICRGESYIQRAVALAFHSPLSTGARWHNPDYEGPVGTVFGGAYRREVFERVGLFDEELLRNQDDEFNLRLIRAGGRIWQSPRIRSWYWPRSSLASLFEQYYQYGFWKVRVIRKHRLPASLRHLVPGALVMGLLLPALATLAGLVMQLIWGSQWADELANVASLVLLVVAAAYLGANLGASVLTAERKGWRFLPVLPAVFAAYHLGYGIGFISGIINFVLLSRTPARDLKLTR